MMTATKTKFWKQASNLLVGTFLLMAVFPGIIEGSELVWSIANNPSSGTDLPYSITTDDDYVYIAGHDNSPGNHQWRIEKRRKSDGSIVWAKTSNPSPNEDDIYSITIDDTYIYVAGYDQSPGDYQWRIEKRWKSDGSIVWTKTSNPSSGNDGLFSIVVDDTYIYVAGCDQSPGDYQWRIEKRRKSDGSIVWTKTSNPSSGNDGLFSIVADDTYIYLAGEDQSLGVWSAQWRIEKRRKSDGSIVWTKTSNPSSNPAIAWSMTSDSDFIYIAGDDRSPGNEQWYIEKRSKLNGDIEWTKASNPSSEDDQAWSITLDSESIYIAGYDQSLGDEQWRIEKRSKLNGDIEWTKASNPSSQDDQAWSITLDSESIYIAGYDESSGDEQWRIEKRSKFDTTGPTGTIFINNDAEYTNSTSVTLNLSAIDDSGVSKMKFSNDGGGWSVEENYATSKAWVLTPGDGPKTVYVQYKDNANNWSGSISDTIILDTTPPQISNLAVNPTTAKAGTNLIITFTVSETLPVNPTVTVAGNAATFSSKSGNNYTYTYGVQGTEGEGSKAVNVSATDSAGNTGSANTTVTFDFTGPTIFPLAVNPPIAKSGTSLTITFTVSETLPVNPTVTVSGNAATFSSKSGNDYTYTYAVKGTEGEGSKAVNVSATDSAGNTGSANTPVTFDFTAPTIFPLAVNPTLAKAATNLSITFTVSEILQGNPAVTVAGNGATFSSKSGNNYTYTYAVKGTEGEGSKAVNVSATDSAGNTGSANTPVTFDFTAPTIFPLAVNPTLAKAGTNLIITFTVSETLPVNPTVTVSGNAATFSSKSGNNYTYTYGVQGTEGEGSKAVNVSATDSAGNTGSANTPVTFDFTAPTIFSLTVNPGTARAGVILTITFTVSETLESNPLVTVAGNAAIYHTKVANNYTYTYTVQGIEGEGSNSPVNVLAADSAWNIGSAFTTVTLDFTGPDCSADNSKVQHREDITIRLTARDDTSGIAVARYNWDTPASDTVGTQYSDGDTIILATDTGTDGKELYLYGKDNAGNTRTWNGTYYLDKTGPICSANKSGTWHTDDITITLSFSAGATGHIITAKYNWDTPVSESTGTEYGNGKTITLDTETNGKTLYLYVKDDLGREKTWSGNYYLDKTDPVCSADKSGTWHKEDITITLTARDYKISGVAVARYRWDTPASATAGIVYSDGSRITLNTETTDRTLYLYIRDNAGRVKTWSGVYYLDKTSPTGSMLINNGAVYTSTTSVTLTFSAEDSGSGVSKMELSNDGEKWSPEEDYAESKSWTLTDGDGEKIEEKTVYVQYKDRAGNWSGIISDAITLDTVRPTVELLVEKASPYGERVGEIVGVIPDTGMEARFSKVMISSSVEQGLKLIAIRNNLNEEIYEEVSLGFEWEGSTKTVITPKSELKKNYIYKLEVTTGPAGVKDLAGNPVRDERELTFRTIMDHTRKNIVVKLVKKVVEENNGRLTVDWEENAVVSLEANALKEDGYLIINREPLSYPLEVNPGAINAANEKSIANGWYPIDGCLWEIKVCNKNGEWIEDNFGSEVKITLPYDEDKGEETFMAFWLNEEHSNWVRVPGSGVDKDNNVAVTGEVPNFSVFALMGTALYDLREAHAYPVPWKPNDGKEETGTEKGGITFTNLAAECVIKIYTISGELVMKHEYKGGGNWTWDVKTSNKEKVFSGVYIYYIEGEKEHKTGRLVIIR